MDGRSGDGHLQIKYEEFMRILAALKEAKWDYARIQLGDLNLIVSNGEVDARDTGGPRAADRRSSETATHGVPASTEEVLNPSPSIRPSGDQHIPSAAHDGAVVVPSPSIGTFWRSPQPGAPPFVEVGSMISTDQTLCIVEVMKLLMHVTAPVSGHIDIIHKKNGELVEYGETLFSIRPAAS